MRLASEDTKVVADRLGRGTTRLTQDVYQDLLPSMQERPDVMVDALDLGPDKSDWQQNGCKSGPNGTDDWNKKTPQGTAIVAIG